MASPRLSLNMFLYIWSLFIFTNFRQSSAGLVDQLLKTSNRNPLIVVVRGNTNGNQDELTYLTHLTDQISRPSGKTHKDHQNHHPGSNTHRGDYDRAFRSGGGSYYRGRSYGPRYIQNYNRPETSREYQDYKQRYNRVYQPKPYYPRNKAHVDLNRIYTNNDDYYSNYRIDNHYYKPERDNYINDYAQDKRNLLRIRLKKKKGSCDSDKDSCVSSDSCPDSNSCDTEGDDGNPSTRGVRLVPDRCPAPGCPGWPLPGKFDIGYVGDRDRIKDSVKDRIHDRIESKDRKLKKKRDRILDRIRDRF